MSCNRYTSDSEIRFFNELVKSGFIVDSNIDEYQRVRTQIIERFTNSNPQSVSYVIAPTLKCNLKCVYCFQKDYELDYDEQFINDITLNRIVQFIVHENRNNKNLKNIRINWFGGEPLLCYDKIIRFSRLLKDALKTNGVQLITGITTNGILLSKEKLEKLISECNLKHMQITVDGEEETYCKRKQTDSSNFYKAIYNINLASRYVKTVTEI